MLENVVLIQDAEPEPAPRALDAPGVYPLREVQLRIRCVELRGAAVGAVQLRPAGRHFFYIFENKKISTGFFLIRCFGNDE